MSTSSGDSSIKRYVQRVSGAKLLVAGAFDPLPMEIACGWARTAWIMIDYQEGAVGGAPQAIIELSDGVGFYRAPIEDESGLTVVAGTGDAAGTAYFVDQEIKRFRPRASFRTALKFALDKSVYAIRPNFAEYPPATIATPGTLGCVVLLSVD